LPRGERVAHACGGRSGVGCSCTGISSGSPPSATAIFETPMNSASGAVSSTCCAGLRCTSSSLRSSSESSRASSSELIGEAKAGPLGLAVGVAAPPGRELLGLALRERGSGDAGRKRAGRAVQLPDPPPTQLEDHGIDLRRVPEPRGEVAPGGKQVGPQPEAALEVVASLRPLRNPAHETASRAHPITRERLLTHRSVSNKLALVSFRSEPKCPPPLRFRSPPALAARAS